VNRNPFLIIGENIHCTRVFLRKGKRIVTDPEGEEAISYTEAGEQRFLRIPPAMQQTQDYAEGRVKHMQVAVRAAMGGDEKAAAEGRRYIRTLVERQESAGAAFLDLNVDEISVKLAEQQAAMRFLVQMVAPLTPLPLAIDSSHVDIIAAGLEARTAAGAPNWMLNSASLERLQALDLAADHSACVVATAAGESAMPDSADERVANAARVVAAAQQRGIPVERIFIDPLVFPISVDSRYGEDCLAAIRRLRERYGTEIHITGGFSNVSFGMPQRKLINDAFLLLAVEAGADSGIVDPVTSKIDAVFDMNRAGVPFKMAEDMLLGRDEYCAGFLKAHRAGELNVG
jgi:cobalamin-dependent methionine synthase I